MSPQRQRTDPQIVKDLKLPRDRQLEVFRSYSDEDLARVLELEDANVVLSVSPGPVVPQERIYAEPEGPGFLERAAATGKGLWRTGGFHPWETAKMAHSFITEPGETLQGFKSGLAGEKVRAETSAQAAEDRGDYGAATIRRVVARVPLVGPSLVTTATRATEPEIFGIRRDPVEQSEAFGEMLGFGMPSLAQLLKKIRIASTTPKSLVQGVETTRGQRRYMKGKSGGPTALAEAFGRQSVFGKDLFIQLDRRSQAALLKLGRDIQGEVESLAATSARVNTGLIAVRNKFKERFSHLDNTLDVFAGDAPASTSAVKRFVAESRKEKLLLPALDDPLVAKVFLNVDKWGDSVPFRKLLKARQQLNDLGFGIDEPVQGVRAGLARRFAALADKELGAVAKKAGPKAARAWKLRNATWKRVQETFNKGIIKKLANDDLGRERLAQWLPELPSKEIRRIRRFSSKEDWQLLKNKHTEFMFKKFTQRDILTGDVPGAEGVLRRPKVHGDKLNDMLENSSMNETLRAIYTPPEISRLRAYADLGEALQGGGVKLASLVGPSADFGIMAYVVSGLLKVATGDLEVGAVRMLGGAGSALGIHVMSRMLSNPEGFASLRQAVRAVGRGDITKGVFFSNRMLDAMSASERAEVLQIASAPKEEIVEERGVGAQILDTAASKLQIMGAPPQRRLENLPEQR